MRPAFMLTALAAATGVLGQASNAGVNLNVMAVNSSNGKIYSVTFTPPSGSTTVGNTDGSNYQLPVALAFVTNATTYQLDLLVADQQRGALYRYPGALTPQTPRTRPRRLCCGTAAAPAPARWRLMRSPWTATEICS